MSILATTANESFHKKAVISLADFDENTITHRNVGRTNKIKGNFNKNKWTEKKLKEYVKQKIKEIEPSFHTELELFQIQDSNINVWVYISALPSEVSDKIVDTWIKAHLKEEGIETKEFKIKVILDVAESLKSDSPRQIMIRLP